MMGECFFFRVNTIQKKILIWISRSFKKGARDNRGKALQFSGFLSLGQKKTASTSSEFIL